MILLSLVRILQWFQSDLCHDWIGSFLLISLFTIIIIFIIEIGYHNTISFIENIKFCHPNSDKKKVWELSTKRTLVYITSVKHQRRQTHLCKFAVFCNLIHYQCCIHPSKQVIRLWIFVLGSLYLDLVVVIILLICLH